MQSFSVQVSCDVAKAGNLSGSVSSALRGAGAEITNARKTEAQGMSHVEAIVMYTVNVDDEMTVASIQKALEDALANPAATIIVENDDVPGMYGGPADDGPE